MNLRRKRNSFKPSVIKRNPAKLNHFHQKNQIKQHFSYFKQNQAGKFDPPARKQSIKSLNVHLPNLNENQFQQADTNLQKNWWTPVWSGLVLDKEAKHKKAIKQAIWLYLYLLTIANRQTGRSFRKLKTIALETGFNQRSIERWLKRLREKGYIETQSTGHSLQISITRWKPISRKQGK